MQPSTSHIHILHCHHRSHHRHCCCCCCCYQPSEYTTFRQNTTFRQSPTRDEGRRTAFSSSFTDDVAAAAAAATAATAAVQSHLSACCCSRVVDLSPPIVPRFHCFHSHINRHHHQRHPNTYCQFAVPRLKDIPRFWHRSREASEGQSRIGGMGPSLVRHFRGQNHRHGPNQGPNRVKLVKSFPTHPHSSILVSVQRFVSGLFVRVTQKRKISTKSARIYAVWPCIVVVICKWRPPLVVPCLVHG